MLFFRCAHCMQMSPLWLKLGERFQNESRVLIADVDCVQSKPICETEKVNSFQILNIRIWIRNVMAFRIQILMFEQQAGKNYKRKDILWSNIVSTHLANRPTPPVCHHMWHESVEAYVLLVGCQDLMKIMINIWRIHSSSILAETCVFIQHRPSSFFFWTGW